MTEQVRPIALVTRSAEHVLPVSGPLGRRGWEAMAVPMLTIRPARTGNVELAGVQAVLATSAPAVRLLADRTGERSRPLLAVGCATAGAARAAGFADVRTGEGGAAGLVSLAARTLTPSGPPLLYVSGREVATDLGDALRTRGFRVRRQILYRADLVTAFPDNARTALSRGLARCVLFYSARVANAWGRLAAGAGIEPGSVAPWAVCMSRRVAEALSPPEWRGVRVARRPTTASLIDAVPMDAE